MLLERLWTGIRRYVPIPVYPLLSPLYRWRQRAHLKVLEKEDQAYIEAHGSLPVPPAELRYRVVGECTIERFINSGEQTVEDIENALEAVDRSLADVRDFLDFGCGCGRLLLALKNRDFTFRVSGCDVDERTIRWCQEHLETAECLVNDALPPTPYQPDSFDLIWCGSVFTHLDEQRQDLWLAELHRIQKPGGLLLASVHGPHAWQPRLPAWTIAKLKEQGILYAKMGAFSGMHPDWYQVAWHTEAYIREHWASFFNILGYLPQGFNNHQDIVVAQKRD